MVRLSGATHESEKALKIFAEMESDGFIETAKHYNAIISALGSTKRFADQAIEFWQKMQTSGVVPDQHTFVAVFRACSKLGDIETAYDALQDMKMHEIKMTEHSYNGLIRTYAGAAAVHRVKEKHVDIYIKDSWDLFEQMKENPEVKINNHILNSLLLLHCNALRTEEIEAYVLPLYEKHKINYDVYTFQNLSKLYLNIGEYNMVKTLFRKLKDSGLTPNQHLLNSVVEAAMRTDDVDVVYEGMSDFLVIKREPH
mmetsp:Transcript_14056/g.23876  ORF Transcript_14056/g.23876 Transcript_14056/m.23876 type:complete len:255 (-) Transcript_14056:272-1036(-)